MPERTTTQYGLMELSNNDLVVWAAEQEELSLLEVELMLRLEQVMETREYVLDRLKTAPCSKCVHFRNLLPENIVDELGSDDHKVFPGESIWA